MPQKKKSGSSGYTSSSPTNAPKTSAGKRCTYCVACQPLPILWRGFVAFKQQILDKTNLVICSG